MIYDVSARSGMADPQQPAPQDCSAAVAAATTSGSGAPLRPSWQTVSMLVTGTGQDRQARPAGSRRA